VKSRLVSTVKCLKNNEKRRFSARRDRLFFGPLFGENRSGNGPGVPTISRPLQTGPRRPASWRVRPPLRSP
jgi:hypothetical protein